MSVGMSSHGKCIDQLFYYVLEYVVHDNKASSDRHVSFFIMGLKLGLRFVLGLGSELGSGLGL